MTLAKKLLDFHSPGNRFSYYPLTSKWEEVKKTAPSLPSPSTEGFGIYIHIPFCREICTYCGCNIKISNQKEEHLQYVKALSMEKKLRWDKINPPSDLLNITFGGGTPNFLNPKAKELLLEELGPLIGAQTSSGQMEVDPRYFTREDAQWAFALKINRFNFGVQDFNSEILSNVNRRQSLDHLHRAKEALLPQQIMGMDLLWGLPKQDERSMKNWYSHLKTLAPDWIYFYPLAKVPWLESIQNAYGDFTLPDRERKYELYQWGVEIFESLGYRNQGMGHFVKKNGPLDQTLYRKVSGLFPQKTPYLMGLGVSAITEGPDFMAQNYKILDRYLFSLLKKNELPLFKFHKKSQKEKQMNQLVEDIFSHHTIPELLKQRVPEEWREPNSNDISNLGLHFKKNIMQIGEKTIFEA